MNFKTLFLVIHVLVSCTYCELSSEKKDKLLNGFIDFYNKLPDQLYTSGDGTLQNAQRLDDNSYKVEAILRVTDVHNLDSSKFVKCKATVQDFKDQGVTVVNNDYHCQDTQTPVVEELADNEVDSNTAVTSDEKSIGVPREIPDASCVGCGSHKNIETEGVTELAKLAVRHLDRHEPHVRHTLNTVLDVERQVQILNGVKYILTLLVDFNNCTKAQTDLCQTSNTCVISILKRKWSKLPEDERVVITNNCVEDNSEVINENASNNQENDTDIYTQRYRTKRQVAGGVTEQNPNDPRFELLAEESLHKYLQTNGIRKPHKVISVDKVTTQLVSGSNTVIYFSVLPIDQETGDVIKCVSSVWEQPWLNRKQIDVNCKRNNHQYRAKRQIAGGVTEQNPNDPRFELLAEESLHKYLQTNGIRKPHKVISVDKVTTQLVSGSNTVIYFSVLPIDQEIGDVIKCVSSVWEQPWLNRKQIDVKCERNNNKYRAKRQIVGGKTERDPNDPRFKLLAEESLQQYLHTNGIRKPHKVISVDQVTTQVVSGSNTVINFSVLPIDQETGEVIKCVSSVWEQAWIHRKQIVVNCERNNHKYRAKRQVAGGVTEQNPNDPRYELLAEESLHKYLQTNGIRKLHKVVSVDKVTTQLVSGSNTVIYFSVLPIYQETGDVIKCVSSVWEQPWLNRKQIDVNCKRNNHQYRAKRQIAGGVTEQNPNDPRFELLAEESLHKYLQTNGIRKPHKVISVDKVTTQLVSGSNTVIYFSVLPIDQETGDLIKCVSSVWEQPWLNRKQIDVNCKRNNHQYRAKRQIAGGVTEQNPNDPRFELLAEESLHKYLQTNGIRKPHKVISVDKVTTQLVSGSNTVIYFSVLPIDQEIGDVIKCVSSVWEQPWLNRKQIDVKCERNNNKYRAKRQIVGGKTERDPNDPRFKLLAEESLQQYLHTNGIRKPHKVISVDKVTTQVVSGSNTVINFSVLPIDQETGEVIKCVSSVWEQAWIHRKQIVVNCERNNHKYRAKRQVAGGVTEQNPNDPRYELLAEESLHKYLQTNGIRKLHKVVSVDKVTTQLVSGSNTVIYFSVLPIYQETGDVIKCVSSVWEQPWLNRKQIDVNCKRNNHQYRAKRQIAGGWWY